MALALRPHPRVLAGLRSGGRRSVPRLAGPPVGGISIVLAVLVASIAFVPLEDAYRGILIGTAIIGTVGIVADVRGLRPSVLFLAQVGAAAVAVAYGVSIDRFTFPVIGVVAELPPWADALLTVAWIVLLMRLVDFVDGLDGLAAAICGTGAVVFVFLSLGLGIRGSAVLSAVIAGACAGFLFRNFYPSKLLLGHTGSLVLGYLVGTVAVEGLLKTAAVVGVLFPFLVLAVPALDSSLAVATRVGARVDPRTLRSARAEPWSRGRSLLVLAAWCGVVAATVVATSAIEFRAHGEWDRWRTLAVAAIAAVLVAGSIYVIGLIEVSLPVGRADDSRTLPPNVRAVGPSPGEAISAARSSGYGSARRGTDIALRLLDVLIAGLALVLLIPVLLVIAGIALVTSGRPLLHGGNRVGREGRVFRMWKIRTLSPDAELRVGRFYGAELDRRMPAEVTRIGRVLRATHLDEVPQLWNVLVGDMSVVGPRPLRPRFFEELCLEIPQYWQRLTVKPGLTGLAQVRIDRAAGWDEKLAHDLEWIADRSVRLYLATALATAWQVLVATASRRWRPST